MNGVTVVSAVVEFARVTLKLEGGGVGSGDLDRMRVKCWGVEGEVKSHLQVGDALSFAQGFWRDAELG